LIAAYLRVQSAEAWSGFDAAAEAHPDDPKAQILAYIEALGERALRPGYRGCGLSNAAVEYPEPKHPRPQGRRRPTRRRCATGCAS
jgi:hypothetical protein